MEVQGEQKYFLLLDKNSFATSHLKTFLRTHAKYNFYGIPENWDSWPQGRTQDSWPYGGTLKWRPRVEQKFKQN